MAALSDGGSQATLRIDDVSLSMGVHGEVDRASVEAMAERLQAAGVGMEPDPRFGPSWPRPGTEVVVFRVRPEASEEPSDAYMSAQVAAGLAAAVAAADTRVSAEEDDLLQNHLAAAVGLDVDETARLSAHTAWLLATYSFPSMETVRGRLAGLEGSRRLEIGQFLVQVASADGHVHPAEHTWLRRAFRAIGLSEDDLNRALNAIDDVKREWEHTGPLEPPVRKRPQPRERRTKQAASADTPKLEKADALLDLLFGD